jgi:hypothetical protein
MAEGLDGVLRYYYDPGIEWTSTGDYIEQATYRGHDGLRRYLGTMRGFLLATGLSINAPTANKAGLRVTATCHGHSAIFVTSPPNPRLRLRGARCLEVG